MNYIQTMLSDWQWVLDGGLATLVATVAYRLRRVRKDLQDSDNADFEVLIAEVQRMVERADRLYNKANQRVEDHIRSRLH